MRRIRPIGAGILLLLLGAVAPTYAQEEKHEQAAKPEKQEQQAKPEKQQQEAKPQKQEQQAKPEKQQEQAKSTKQQEEQKQAKGQQEQQQKQQQQANSTKQEEQKPAKGQQEQQQKRVQQATGQKENQHEQQQHAQRSPAEEQRQRAVPALRLSARSEGRIPDDRYRSNFGRDHEFRIGSPRLVDGYSRFQYGGYWFGFVQPWPVGWYYTDDVYVEYIDGGYYLYNPYYPDTRISINVVI